MQFKSTIPLTVSKAEEEPKRNALFALVVTYMLGGEILT